MRVKIHKCNATIDNLLFTRDFLNKIKEEVGRNFNSIQDIFENMVTEFKNVILIFLHAIYPHIRRFDPLYTEQGNSF